MIAATVRHEPTEECDGTPARMPASISHTGDAFTYRCPECGVALCWCEVGYGHECDDETATGPEPGALVLMRD